MPHIQEIIIKNGHKIIHLKKLTNKSSRVLKILACQIKLSYGQDSTATHFFPIKRDWGGHSQLCYISKEDFTIKLTESSISFILPYIKP
jgi:hypothetical protein